MSKNNNGNSCNQYNQMYCKLFLQVCQKNITWYVGYVTALTSQIYYVSINRCDIKSHECKAGPLSHVIFSTNAHTYLGGCILNLSKTSGQRRGNTTISFSAEMCLLRPPMLSNRTWMTKGVMFRLFAQNTTDSTIISIVLAGVQASIS